MKLPQISGKNFTHLLHHEGFEVEHQTGSHVHMKHQDGRLVIVPVHDNKELGKGLLLELLKEARLPKEAFEHLLHKHGHI